MFNLCLPCRSSVQFLSKCFHNEPFFFSSVLLQIPSTLAQYFPVFSAAFNILLQDCFPLSTEPDFLKHHK